MEAFLSQPDCVALSLESEDTLGGFLFATREVVVYMNAINLCNYAPICNVISVDYNQTTVIIPVQERFPRQQGAERGDGLGGFQRGPTPRVARGGDAAQRVDLRPDPVGHDERQGNSRI